jgi:hypothetical protein
MKKAVLLLAVLFSLSMFSQSISGQHINSHFSKKYKEDQRTVDKKINTRTSVFRTFQKLELKKNPKINISIDKFIKEIYDENVSISYLKEKLKVFLLYSYNENLQQFLSQENKILV